MIKLLGQLLVWTFLGTGAISAATAYLVSLETDAESAVGLTLAAPTGNVTGTDGKPIPIAEKGDKITGPLLDTLLSDDVKYVRVKEFSVARWRAKWWFILSLGGLLAGALLTRWAARPTAASQKADARQSPDQIVDTLQRVVDGLRAKLPKETDRQTQLEMIVQPIGQLQKTEIPALVESRDLLVAQMGLSGYAVLMDHFSAAERQLNRAWSAAVDGAYDEAVLCLDESVGLLQDTRAALHGSVPETA